MTSEEAHLNGKYQRSELKEEKRVKFDHLGQKVRLVFKHLTFNSSAKLTFPPHVEK